MTSNDAWRRAIEDKYIKDFQRLPVTRARRDFLFAKWAAQELGRNDIDAYVEEVRLSSATSTGDAALLHKVLEDLRAAGLNVKEEGLRSILHEMMFEAAAELEAANPIGIA